MNAWVLALAVGVVVWGGALAQGQTAQVPNGISDLLGTTPTMLSPLDLRANRGKTTRSTGNTITISRSQIVFARADKPTLVATIASLIENSEPNVEGDELLATTIRAVLGAQRSDAVATQIRDAIACRAHKETLRQCVATLVDGVVADDDDTADATKDTSATADKTP